MNEETEYIPTQCVHCKKVIQEKPWKSYKAHLVTLIVIMEIVTIKQGKKHSFISFDDGERLLSPNNDAVVPLLRLAPVFNVSFVKHRNVTLCALS